MQKRLTFYEPSYEALCDALVDFLDTRTEEKERQFLQSEALRMIDRMHMTWMADNGDRDAYKVNRFKRVCQAATLVWIEAKHPALFEHLKLDAQYIEAKIRGSKPDPSEFMVRHWKECSFCTRNQGVSKKQ